MFSLRPNGHSVFIFYNSLNIGLFILHKNLLDPLSIFD